MDKLLAGPILRRAESRRFFVWLATSTPATVRGWAYDNDDAGSTPTGRSHEQGSRRVKLGEKLYIHLVEILPNDGTAFPHDTLIYYNLKIDDDSLDELGLIGTHSNSITYPGAKLPSLFIPNQLTNFLFGSCRKPHANSSENGISPDRLSVADDILSDAVSDLSKRPAALFLTGDQIYADDVGMPQLEMLQNKSPELLGWAETLQSKHGAQHTFNLSEQARVLRSRAAIVKDRGLFAFTSSHAENHLLGFGEYAAMYLSTLSPHDYAYPVWDEVSERIEYDDDGEPGDENSWFTVTNTYFKQLNNLISFNRSLGKVRRLLANTPTYMIFDDHEVTDDWNISQAWKSEVSDSLYGETVLTNALTAYWAFQGWGNDPDEFNDEFIEAVETTINLRNKQPQDIIKLFKELDKHNWSFAAPFDIPTLFLNTRTQRDFDTEQKPARLMDANEHARIKGMWNSLSQGESKPAIIISAVPVLGFSPFEQLQNMAAWSESLVRIGDVESWSTNKNGFNDIIKTIRDDLSPKWCLILSGDLHLSYAASALLKNDGTGTGTRCYQATSSPFDNDVSSFIPQLLAGSTTETGSIHEYIEPDNLDFGIHTTRNNVGLVTLENAEPKAFQLAFSSTVRSTYNLSGVQFDSE